MWLDNFSAAWNIATNNGFQTKNLVGSTKWLEAEAKQKAKDEKKRIRQEAKWKAKRGDAW